jgi:hypothetical protein
MTGAIGNGVAAFLPRQEPGSCAPRVGFFRIASVSGYAEDKQGGVPDKCKLSTAGPSIGESSRRRAA